MIKIIFLSLLMIFYINTLPSKAQTTISNTQALEDLDFMVKTIEETHYNPYLNISKEEWKKEISKYKQKYKSLPKISVSDFTIDMQKLIAGIKDNLSTVSYSRKNLIQYLDSNQFFPSFLRWSFGGASGELKKLKIYDEDLFNGEELLEINGQNAKQLYEEAQTIVNGTDAFKKYYLDYAFSLFLFHKGIRAPFTLTFLAREDRDIWSLEDRKAPSEANSLKQTSNILKTLPNIYLPTLRQLVRRLYRSEQPYWLKFLEPDITYIAYDRCEDMGRFEAFLDSSFRVIKEKNIKKLILDVRYNMAAGTTLNNLNDLLLSYITEKPYRQFAERRWKVSQALKERMDSSLYQNNLDKAFINTYLKAKNGTYLKEEFALIKPKKPTHFFEGKTCVLMGVFTDTNAAYLADAVDTYELATIIGNPTGQFTNNFSEFLFFEMPHSKLKFTSSIAYNIGADGDAEKQKVVLPYIDSQGNPVDFVRMWFDGK